MSASERYLHMRKLAREQAHLDEEEIAAALHYLDSGLSVSRATIVHFRIDAANQKCITSLGYSVENSPDWSHFGGVRGWSVIYKHPRKAMKIDGEN